MRAFSVARGVFFRDLVSMSDGEMVAAVLREVGITTDADADVVVAKSGHGDDDDDGHGEVNFPISVVTAIILLFDCEHLTACNWRKRRLACLLRSVDPVTMNNNATRDRVVRTLENELTLLESFISSPLHRHTKSPTLWQHRLWTLDLFLRVRGSWPVSSEEDAFSLKSFQDLFNAELAIVLRSGEQHPRNYYAFTYLRRLHDTLSTSAYSVQRSSMDMDYSVELARSVISPALDWCLSYPSDISGWMFVFYLLEAVPEQAFRTSCLARVVRFASSVGWEGESLWAFVDLGARRFGSVGVMLDILRSQGSVDTVGGSRPWKAWVARARVCRAGTNRAI